MGTFLSTSAGGECRVPADGPSFNRGPSGPARGAGPSVGAHDLTSVGRHEAPPVHRAGGRRRRFSPRVPPHRRRRRPRARGPDRVADPRPVESRRRTAATASLTRRSRARRLVRRLAPPSLGDLRERTPPVPASAGAHARTPSAASPAERASPSRRGSRPRRSFPSSPPADGRDEMAGDRGGSEDDQARGAHGAVLRRAPGSRDRPPRTRRRSPGRDASPSRAAHRHERRVGVVVGRRDHRKRPPDAARRPHRPPRENGRPKGGGKEPGTFASSAVTSVLPGLRSRKWLFSAICTARCVLVPSTPPITTHAPRSYTSRVTSTMPASTGSRTSRHEPEGLAPVAAGRVLLLDASTAPASSRRTRGDRDRRARTSRSRPRRRPAPAPPAPGPGSRGARARSLVRLCSPSDPGLDASRGAPVTEDPSGPGRRVSSGGQEAGRARGLHVTSWRWWPSARRPGSASRFSRSRGAI